MRYVVIDVYFVSYFETDCIVHDTRLSFICHILIMSNIIVTGVCGMSYSLLCGSARYYVFNVGE